MHSPTCFCPKKDTKEMTIYFFTIIIIAVAVARVLVPATIILKFAVPVVFKIRNSNVYR